MTTIAETPTKLTAKEKVEMQKILDDVFGGFRPSIINDEALKDPDVKRYDELSRKDEQYKAYIASIENVVIESDAHEGSDSSKNTFLNPDHLYSLCCDTIEEGLESMDKLIAYCKKC